MARFARVVLPGIPHHVTQRGNRRQQTFFTSRDYEKYIELLAEACESSATACWAYCVMPNHTHLVLVPANKQGLCSALAQVHKRYARRINRRFDWTGHLWQERFHSTPLDEYHLLATVRYVERNPVRAHIVDRPQDWFWSSARAHIAGLDDMLVDVSPLLARVSDWKTYLDNENNDETEEAIRSHTKTGRPLGSDDFLRIAERRTGRKLTRNRRGPKKRKTTNLSPN